MKNLPAHGWITGLTKYMGGSINAVLILFLGFLLNACALQSNVPLSPPDALPANSPIIGTWVGSDPGEHSRTYVHVGNVQGVAKIIEVDFHDQGEMKSESQDVSFTLIDGVNYISLKMTDSGKTSYMLMKLVFEGNDTVLVKTANYQFLADAVGKGLVKGAVVSKPIVPYVFLSEDATALQGFIAKYSDQIFSEGAGRFNRVQQ